MFDGKFEIPLRFAKLILFGVSLCRLLIMKRIVGGWSQQQILGPGPASSRFGWSVVVSGSVLAASAAYYGGKQLN